jgi:hypothetical protein
MSGPKSSSWEVVENERLRQARIVAARGEIVRSEREISAIVAALRPSRPDLAGALEAAAGQRLDRRSADAGPEPLESVLARLRQLIVDARGHQQAEESACRLNAEIERASEKIRKEASRRTAQARSAAQQEQERRRALAERLLARVPDRALAAERARVEEMLRVLIGAESATARTVEGELRAELQRLAALSSAREMDAARAASLRALLRGFKAPRAREIDRRLAAVEAGEARLEAGLVAEAQETEAQLRREADALYAGEVLKEELAALGYAVGESFATAFCAGGELIVRKPALADYAVSFAFEPGANICETELVAFSRRDHLAQDEIRRRDSEAESAWCRDLAVAMSRAEAKHIRARVRSKVRPGTAPVRDLAAAKAATRQRQQRTLLARPLGGGSSQ